MGSEIVDMSQLLQITQNTAMSVNAQSKQMGLILGTVEDLKNEVTDVKAIVNGLNDRVIVLEEDEALKPYQVFNVKKAVRTRVADLLKVKFDKRGGATDDTIGIYRRYYGKFCGRLHNDAKCAGIEGTAWKYTPRKNYQKLIEFVANWTPARGVDGLKKYFDDLAKEE